MLHAVSWLCVDLARFWPACSDWSRDGNWIHEMVFYYLTSSHYNSTAGCSYIEAT